MPHPLRVWFRWALGALLLTGAAAAPQDSRFFIHHYTVQEGLAQDQPVAIHQDPDGYIWIGTLGGLSRYNGRSFTTFSVTDGLPSPAVFAIHGDRLGRLWVGTSAGAAVLSGSRFTPYTFRTLRETPSVRDIAELTDGTLYFATNRGLVELRGDQERLLSQADRPHGDVLHSVAVASHDSLYVGGEAGLSRLRAGQLTPLPQVNGPGRSTVRSIFHHATTGELLLCRPDRLTLLNADGRCTDIRPDSRPDTIYLDAAIDRQGTIWVAASTGVYYRFPGAPFRRLDVADGLSNRWVYRVMVDYEDIVWLCTDSGVDKITDRSIRHYGVADGLASELIWAVHRWRGRVLVGTEAGLQSLGADGVERDTLLSDRTVTEIVPVGSDALWLGTDHGIYRLQGRRVQAALNRPEPTDLFVYCLQPLPDGSLLMASDRGLYCGRPPELATVEAPAALRSHACFDLLLFGADRCWVGTDYGVFEARRNNDRWRYLPQPILGDVNVTCFARRADDDIYIGTVGRGIYHWDGRRFAPMGVALPDANANVWALQHDRHGQLWVGTSRGIARLAGDRFENFNAVHGLPFTEITNKRCFLLDSDDAFYFGTSRSLLVYRPQMAAFSAPPRVRITGVTINQTELPPPAAGLHLNHDDRLTIRFDCLSFLNEAGNTFQYQLEGVDSVWQPPTDDRHVVYPFLPPGQMIFHLRAVNARGVVSRETPALVVEVSPPFTSTVWFFLLILLGVSAVIGTFAAYKIHLDRTERDKLRRMVQARTAELAESEEKYRHLVDGSLVGICILQDWRVVYINPVITELLCHPPDKILGTEVIRFVFPEDIPILQRNMALRDAGDIMPHEYETRFVCGDGTVRSVLIRATVTTFNGRSAILANLVDLTETKRLQEQVVHYQKLESIGTLAGGIAHDFNNILQGITGYTSLVRMQVPPDSPLQGDLAMIEEAAARATVLTRKLLGFARKGKYVVQVFDLHEAIDSVITFSRRTIPYTVEFERAFHAGPLWVRGDRTQMEQVLLNLFLNARDAMPDGGRIRVETQSVNVDGDLVRDTHVLKTGRYIRLVVADTGTGIDPANLPRVFDPFFTTKAQGQGSGLGLATVYGIVKNHQGYIYLDSEPGRGTRVLIFLPATDAPAPAAAESAADAGPEAALPLAGRRLLVVDDESLNRLFLNRLLRTAGADILEAADGQQAVRVFQDHADDIDCVILDINMPVKSGDAALAEIQSIRADVPVVVLSGYGEDASVYQMLRRGCRGFLHKPVDAVALLRLIGTILNPPAATETGAQVAEGEP
ncbi:MAG TPA: two-component regulator propeller domain-containing protein [Acidobacteriota bacterium]|nr:two-component regulator propeller domain-containing protein [Acidobacteriota bacterium]HQG91086.1 two-component regulator propeller domain-containing protein [Acidobacteriota bacterium]